ncbi:MAG: isoprenyl transferase [Bdellovibrionota bacterium]
MAIPNHLAIIMDGNGRWAQKRNKPRAYGHVRGTRNAKDIIRECSKQGVKYLTLYAFSSENWLRPQPEVQILMRLLRKYLHRETANLIKENIRLQVIGDLDRVPVEVKNAINASTSATASCDGMTLVFALSYGSRQEITETVRTICEKVERKEISIDKINESLIGSFLSTAPTPDPDLIIRTSGEKRLSNFLLWQAAYSEFYFSETLWPDFNIQELHEAFQSFDRRERRFGRVEPVKNHDQLSN